MAGDAPNIPSYRFPCVYLTSSSRAADLVSTLVASTQIRIHHADTLDYAKARLQATKARIMLTDVTFERGGWEDAMRMAASLPLRTAVVLVSPLADQRLWIDALECGAYDLILEPFDADELRWILENAQLSATSPSTRRAAVSAGLHQDCPLGAPDSVGPPDHSSSRHRTAAGPACPETLMRRMEDPVVNGARNSRPTLLRS
jgi:DNA-binding NarL/FixJ family response regulator